MTQRATVPDHSITQRVGQQLTNRGVRPPCQVAVATGKGNVTLSGTIQYEHQRRIATHAARGVEGVQRVVDQLRVIPKKQHWN